jgi:hypothetical protein
LHIGTPRARRDAVELAAVKAEIARRMAMAPRQS